MVEVRALFDVNTHSFPLPMMLYHLGFDFPPRCGLERISIFKLDLGRLCVLLPSVVRLRGIRNGLQQRGVMFFGIVLVAMDNPRPVAGLLLVDYRKNLALRPVISEGGSGEEIVRAGRGCTPTMKTFW